ncbi:ACP S-acetyltransferase [Thermococcus profundus]|uniref:2-C-methyl-D-erythritol 4-phosphate cytidylyltransferase n=1 Tax=Thermococcus profundus TaxID=49899 RepID=A0A2Z2MI35_THEPR|nr:2-C-methyl-D-erythritol 4-phosphate cytidylyltransferase [Thermococcus profundus]ASJ02091.1 ACP S-acetyltransferase [Thermococcus profundus]
MSYGKTVAIILAGGTGSRVGWDVPKQFVKIAGKKVIEHTLDVFQNHPLVDEIYVVINPNYYEYFNEVILSKYPKIRKVLNGGNTRQESSRIGVFATEDDVENILIHDAVRPLITSDIITRVIKALENSCAVDVVIPAVDTVVVSDGHKILRIPPRGYLYYGQTPQGFKRKVILKAHKLAEEEGFDNATDDCSLVLRYDLCDVTIVQGSKTNIKFTYDVDYYLLDILFQLRNEFILDENITRDHIESLLSALRDKVIVVFGGTSGIGEKIVDISRGYGAKVYPFSRRLGVDVSNPQDVERAIKEVYEREGRIDYIINTAGILYMGPIQSRELKDIQNEINVNYLGSIYVTKFGLKYLAPNGAIVLFGSSSYTRGRRNYSVYSSTKAALVNFVQAVSDEISDKGQRIFIVVPERTKTPLRIRNFGYEPDETLLMPESVAYVTLLALTSGITGVPVPVRKSVEEKTLRKLGLID